LLDASDTTKDQDTGRWYVAHCKPLKEGFAAAALKETLGLVVYAPEVTRLMRGKVQPAPYFPGYLFVRADLRRTKLSSINATPGVVRVLDFGGGPVVVPDATLATIREWVERLNARGGSPGHAFRPGDAVWLTKGPLRGMQAVFVGPTTPSARVKVLLQMLGRLNEVQVEVTALARARSSPPAPAYEQSRRTRGRGRRIS